MQGLIVMICALTGVEFEAGDWMYRDDKVHCPAMTGICDTGAE